jgi:hypothetical protein
MRLRAPWSLRIRLFPSPGPTSRTTLSPPGARGGIHKRLRLPSPWGRGAGVRARRRQSAKGLQSNSAQPALRPVVAAVSHRRSNRKPKGDDGDIAATVGEPCGLPRTVTQMVQGRRAKPSPTNERGAPYRAALNLPHSATRRAENRVGHNVYKCFLMNILSGPIQPLFSTVRCQLPPLRSPPIATKSRAGLRCAWFEQALANSPDPLSSPHSYRFAPIWCTHLSLHI